MRKLFIISALASTVLFMVNCTPKAGKAVAETPTVETKDQIASKFAPAQLDQGKALFAGNCAKCHKLKEPASRTPTEWDKVLKRMIPKAKLSETDGQMVRAYLIANAKEG